MEEKDLKSMIESILMEMVGNKPEKVDEPARMEAPIQQVAVAEPVLAELAQTTQPVDEETEDGECLDDITKVDLRKLLLVPDPADREGYMKMKEKTPARLGVWRAGPRYKTFTSLRFRADHAGPHQDAVFSYVSDEFVKEMNLVAVETMCRDKDEYITRPDLGRQFSTDTIEYIKKHTTKQAEGADDRSETD